MFKGGMFYKDIANYFGTTKNQVHYGISELKKLGVIENIDYRVKGVKRNGR
jgi:DNA-binding Lrp family transcriptional regulator